MVGIITTPEAEIEQKREVKLTNGSGVPSQGTTANGFSELVAQFIVPSEQRSGVGVNVPVQPVIDVRPPWGTGVPTWVRDSTANDSDKSWTVPAGKTWDLKLIYAGMKCTATVGNRVMRGEISNGTAIVWYGYPTSSIAASQDGGLTYLKGYGEYASSTSIRMPPHGSTANAGIQDYLPDVILPAGYVVRIWDTGAIDAAADDLTVVLYYIEYSV